MQLPGRSPAERYRRAAAGFLGPWVVRITRPGGSGRPRRFRTEPATQGPYTESRSRASDREAGVLQIDRLSIATGSDQLRPIRS